MFDVKPLLTGDLSVASAKTKVRRDLNLNLFGAKNKLVAIKKENQEEGSFYGQLPEDEDEGIGQAIDFFSLPTPEVMKTFLGHNLTFDKTPSAVNTPTADGNNFAEGTMLNFPLQRNQDGIDRFLNPTPTKNPGSSLMTPIIDPNNTRPSFSGHLLGIAPCATMNTPSGMPFASSGEAFSRVHINSNVETTHTVVSEPTNLSSFDDESVYSSSNQAGSSNMYAAPSTSHQENYAELMSNSACLPTVIEDHMYTQSTGSNSCYSPSATSQVSNTDNKDFHRSTFDESASTRKRKASSFADKSEGTKKSRMTKKQQLLELISRENNLSAENEYLRRTIETTESACKRLKQMVYERMKGNPRPQYPS